MFVLALVLYIAGTSGWATGLLLVGGFVSEMAAWATLARRDEP
ncbi:hypothetical protein [Ideonella sp. A 288]|nr:hypothetical protein [Ideonella sp. A 288]